jgi:hypothetical protein
MVGAEVLGYRYVYAVDILFFREDHGTHRGLADVVIPCSAVAFPAGDWAADHHPQPDSVDTPSRSIGDATPNAVDDAIQIKCLSTGSSSDPSCLLQPSDRHPAAMPRNCSGCCCRCHSIHPELHREFHARDGASNAGRRTATPDESAMQTVEWSRREADIGCSNGDVVAVLRIELNDVNGWRRKVSMV